MILCDVSEINAVVMYSIASVRDFSQSSAVGWMNDAYLGYGKREKKRQSNDKRTTKEEENLSTPLQTAEHFYALFFWLVKKK